MCWIDFEKLAIEMHLKNAASANTRFFQLKKKLSDMISNPTSAMDITDQDDNESADDEKPDPPVKIEDVCEVFTVQYRALDSQAKLTANLVLECLIQQARNIASFLVKGLSLRRGILLGT